MHWLQRALVICLGYILFCHPASAATFTVTTTAESGLGSLQQAITDANASPGADVINFNISSGGPQTIVLNNGLPQVTEAVTIDGWTQPGFSGKPLIELAGTGTGGSAYYGLRFFSGNNVVRGLVMNRFIWYGIFLESGSSGNRIEGNWIGIDTTGKSALGMNGNGITVNGGTNNIIGGTNAVSRNVVSGNTYYGIAIYGSGNTIQGNYVGTDVDGTNAIPNGFSFNGTGNWAAGVWLEGTGATGNLIGGTIPGAGNLISGNIRGVVMYSGAKSNLVQGNIVGLNAAGTSRVNGNQQLTGVYIVTSDANLVGGTNNGARNIISGNGKASEGIEGHGLGFQGSFSNIVQGNFIGTDVTGAIAVGNLRDGVNVQSGANNTIGGTVAAARNIVSGNGGGGITLWESKDNFVQGNSVGTLADGISPLGNLGNGIHLLNASGNTIGGTTAASGNIIAFNGSPGGFSGYGVFIAEQFSVRSTNNLIRRNSIFGNANLGIELFNSACFGCSPFNDAGDGDAGPNGLQNFPVLTNAATSGGSISISGTLNSKPNSAFTIDFFANPQLKPDGFGEGKTFIGSSAVVTDASGNATFTSFFTDAGYTGQFISATATDGLKNTSEFSAVVTADGPGGALQFYEGVSTVGEGVGNVTIYVTRLAGTSGTATVQYAASNGTATAGSDYTLVSGTLTFADGETFQSFNLPILNDSNNEPNETVILTLSSPSGGAQLGPRSNSVVVITDDDPILVTANDAAVTKSSTGTNTMLFSVTLSGPSTQPISVLYATTNITAEAGVDYVATSGRIDFTPGVTNQFIAVTILADGLQEGSKSFLLSLSNPTNATFGDSQALGTIYDGTQGVLQFGSTTFGVIENNPSAFITVTRQGGSLGTVSVPFSANSGSATSGSDFTATNGVLTFNNGQTNLTFVVAILDDSFNEASETVLLKLGSPSGTTLGNPSQAVLTIQDNDLPPALSVQMNAGSFVLSWPTQAADFYLESSGALTGGAWTTVSNSPGVSGAQFVLTNSVSQASEFFRLRR